MVTTAVGYIEAYGGPLDGTPLPAFGPSVVIGLSPAGVFHRYDRVREDDGSWWYRYAGSFCIAA